MDKPNLKGVKDPEVLSYISYLEERLRKIIENPRWKSYAAARSQVDNWNDQITLHISERPNPENAEQKVQVLGGFIDLFADKDSKEFDRVWKFISEVGALEDALEKMLLKLDTKEKESAETAVSTSSAEYHMYRKKNQ